MKKLILLIGLVFLLIPISVLAAQFKTGENVAVGKDETAKNLYVVGSHVSIDGTINGDLVGAGRTVDIIGNVENSLFAAGSVVNVRGTVGQNSRLAGGDVSIYGNVGEDLAIAGGNILITKDSVVSGDTMLAGSVADITGTINGNLYLVGDKVTISGTILGNVVARDVTSLKISENAKISGKLTYYSPNQAEISSTASVGSVDYHKVSKDMSKAGIFKPDYAYIVYSFLSVFVALLILIALFPRWMKYLAENAFDRPLPKIGYGFLALFATPIVILIALIVSVGLLAPLVGLLGFIYATALILSAIISSLIMGVMALKLFAKNYNYEVDWKVALIGSLIIAVLGLIPVLGGLITFVFFLWALGELTHQFFSIKRN